MLGPNTIVEGVIFIIVPMLMGLMPATIAEIVLVWVVPAPTGDLGLRACTSPCQMHTVELIKDSSPQRSVTVAQKVRESKVMIIVCIACGAALNNGSTSCTHAEAQHQLLAI